MPYPNLVSNPFFFCFWTFLEHMVLTNHVPWTRGLSIIYLNTQPSAWNPHPVLQTRSRSTNYFCVQKYLMDWQLFLSDILQKKYWPVNHSLLRSTINPARWKREPCKELSKVTLTFEPSVVRPKMKRGQDKQLSICSYVAEKPCGCLYKLTCCNTKFHSLFKCKLYL